MLVKVTTPPLLAVAATVKLLLKVALAGGLVMKVMVWFAGCTVKVPFT